MKIFLLKDVERVGLSGQMIVVPDGYARNFIIPRKLGIEVTASNEKSFENRNRRIEERKEIAQVQTSVAADRIKELTLSITRKAHDGDKLYGAISAGDIVDLLAQKGVSVSKNQIELDKPIKKTGTHSIVIKLSSRLKPELTLKIIPEAA